MKVLIDLVPSWERGGVITSLIAFHCLRSMGCQKMYQFLSRDRKAFMPKRCDFDVRSVV
jgi:hypothetical protein